MSEFTKFSPRNPEKFTVKGGQQTLISSRPSSYMYTVLYVTNNSDVPVYIGFTDDKTSNGNATVMAGITIFPKSTFVFDDPVPGGCNVWATCEKGSEAIIGVQQ